MTALSPEARTLVSRLIQLTAAGRLGSPEWRETSEALAEDPSYRWACPTPSQVRLADGTDEDLVGRALVDPDTDYRPFVVAAAIIDQADVSFLVDVDGLLHEFGPHTVLEEPAPCQWAGLPVDAVRADW